MPQHESLKMMYFHKAESRAKWSYIGILFPIIGVILGFMAWSTTGQITAENEEEQLAKQKIINSAGIGIFLSVFSGFVGYLFITAFLDALSRNLSSIGS